VLTLNCEGLGHFTKECSNFTITAYFTIFASDWLNTYVFQAGWPSECMYDSPCPWGRGKGVIASASSIKDPGFESRQVLIHFSAVVKNLLCFVIVCV
jgi:hypothetical protein